MSDLPAPERDPALALTQLDHFPMLFSFSARFSLISDFSTTLWTCISEASL
jgi:hypothetical protein